MVSTVDGLASSGGGRAWKGGKWLLAVAAGGLVVAGSAGVLPIVQGSSGSGSNTAAPTQAASNADKAKATAAYGKLGLSFEQNKGQSDAQVDYLARGQGYTVFLTPSESVVSLQRRQAQSPDPGPASAKAHTAAEAPAVLGMQLLGADPAAQKVATNPLPGKANYFVGSDSSQWKTDVPTFGQVAYQGVYPGIDVDYHGTSSGLEYDFVVAPGADPSAIRLGMTGADGLSISPEGDLVMSTPNGEVRHQAPVVFQGSGADRQTVPAHFVLKGDNVIGFELGAFDASRPLVIDPVLGWGTYLGGNANDFGFGIAVDNDGNTYLGGQTGSANFPTTPTAVQPTYQGGPDDAYVSKMSADGSTLLYSTYLGGSRTDAGWDLSIDSAGNAYLVGSTESADDPGTTAVETGFPTTGNAYDRTCGTDGKCNDVLPFNFKNPGCDPLVPTCSTRVVADAVTTSASAVVTSAAGSFTADDVGAAVLGTGIPASTVISSVDSPNQVTLSNNATASGTVSMTVNRVGYLPAICPPATFPTGCTTTAGPADNFLAKLNKTGSTLLYSSFLGGSSAELNADEVPYAGQAGIALKGKVAYLTSGTYSSDFPTTASAFQPACDSCADGVDDAYMTVIDTGASGAASLKYSTYIGGSGFDEGKAVAVDPAGNGYVTGTITVDDPTPGATSFPTKNPLTGNYLGSGAYDGSTYHGGYSDAFVTKINPKASGAASLVYSDFVGGGGKDEGWGITVPQNGSKAQPPAYLTGWTASGANPHPQVEDPAHPGACASGPGPWCDWASDAAPYFPVTAGAFDTTFGGRATNDSGSTLFLDGDAYAMRMRGDGLKLQYSTFIGGQDGDNGQGIALDSAGYAYVTGWTTCRSQDPPPVGGTGTAAPPPQFDPDGTPTGRNPGEPAATGVPDCPLLPGDPGGFPQINPLVGHEMMIGTNNDNHINDSPTAAFLTKLTPDGSAAVYSILVDGRGFDRGFSVAVRDHDAAGNPITPEAYITGRTGNATNFLVTPGAYDTTYNGSGRDAFIVKIVG